jgi:hypothetical protein
MAAPKYDLCQLSLQNPHASAPLNIPLVVVLNTPDEEIEANTRENTARDLPWLSAKDAHDGIAVMVGGGASVADHLDDIRSLVKKGATVFAMNAASQYLRSKGILPNWQVTCDAKKETSTLIDPFAQNGYLLASHVNPETIMQAQKWQTPILWHSSAHVNELWLPEKKRKRGGYALLGGEASTGLGALCVAYCLGFRRLEIFGYDSCHKGGQSHAYSQPMNYNIPVMMFEWAGRTFQTSITMRAQAERFPITAQALQQAGAAINVWGDGLLQHMWNSPPENLSEKDKYTNIWKLDSYRECSPGEIIAPIFLDVMKVEGNGPVIDFGCGTGRGGLALAKAGLDVTLTDFVSGSRDHEALTLPFLEWDLTKPCPLRAPYGYCTDVMEHIPPEDVEKVIQNIMQSAGSVFFQISTAPDAFGAVIGHDLHLSVHPHEWWREKIESFGFKVVWNQQQETASLFHVTR